MQQLPTVGLGESSRQAMTDYLYKSTKLITETEIGTFVTQFINCKKGVSVGRLRVSGKPYPGGRKDVARLAHKLAGHAS